MAQRLPEETREAIRQAYLGPREKAGVGEYLDHTTTSLFALPTLRDVAAAFGVRESTVWRIARDYRPPRTPSRRAWRLTPEEQEQIISAYAQGWKLREITRTFRVSRQHIWTLTRQAGAPARRQAVA